MKSAAIPKSGETRRKRTPASAGPGSASHDAANAAATKGRWAVRPFWRVVIAVIFGSIADFAVFIFFSAPVTILSGSFTIFVPMAAIPVGIYLLLPERWETRCRECGHILRGLTEPGCPKCGQRI